MFWNMFQKLLPHKAICTPLRAILLTPFLAARPKIRVRSQYNLAVDTLVLVTEERSYVNSFKKDFM